MTRCKRIRRKLEKKQRLTDSAVRKATRRFFWLPQAGQLRRLAFMLVDFYPSDTEDMARAVLGVAPGLPPVKTYARETRPCARSGWDESSCMDFGTVRHLWRWKAGHQRRYSFMQINTPS